jgi:hypothetical protein
MVQPIFIESAAWSADNPVIEQMSTKKMVDNKILKILLSMLTSFLYLLHVRLHNGIANAALRAAA